MNKNQSYNNSIPPYQKEKMPQKKKKMIIGIVVGYVVLDAIILGTVGVFNRDKLLAEKETAAVLSETALSESIRNDLTKPLPVEEETTVPSMATTTTTKPSTTAPTSTTTTTKPTTTTTIAAPSTTKSSAGGSGGGWEGHTTSVKNTTKKYVLNTDSKKIHFPDCNDVDKIDPNNYDEIDNFEEAEEQGYTPCGHCNPF